MILNGAIYSETVYLLTEKKAKKVSRSLPNNFLFFSLIGLAIVMRVYLYFLVPKLIFWWVARY